MSQTAWARRLVTARRYPAGPVCGQRGFVLTLVLITLLVIEVIAVGVLAVVFSELHGAAAHYLAMQAVHVAEAGLNYGVAEMVVRAASAVPTDQAYAGEDDDHAMLPAPGFSGGAFRITVRCAYPSDAVPPACQDNPSTPASDERDLRLVTSQGFVPGRPGRARRQIEALIRRYVPPSGDWNVFGICGSERVELGPDTAVAADIGSNGDVLVDGPQVHPRAVAARTPHGPAWAPVAEAVEPPGAAGLSGVYSWRVTFVDQQGEESGGSPPTARLTLAHQQGRLSLVPVGGPSVARRRIYRSAAGASSGPWFLVGEIPDNEAREYTDGQLDSALRWPIPGLIAGRVTAAGAVSCTKGCKTQVEGQVVSGAREVVCPNFLAVPANPGTEPVPDSVKQTIPIETARWGLLRVPADSGLGIETLSVPQAELHIHVTDLHLERGAQLAITGAATVYFHVRGRFVLDEGAVFGAMDYSGNLLSPADRVHVLLDHRGPASGETEGPAVRWLGENKVAAMVFAPGASVLIERARAFRGGLYGRDIRISRSRGIHLNPIEGLGSERSVVRPSPFQYILRWYDHPSPGGNSLQHRAAGVAGRGR